MHYIISSILMVNIKEYGISAVKTYFDFPHILINKCFLVCDKCTVLCFVLEWKKYKKKYGAQWLSGRVLDSRLRGCGLEPHRRHCVVSLSKTHLFLLSTGSTQEDPSRHNCKIVERDIKNKIKQTKSEEKWTLCQKATDYWIGMMTKM